MSAIEVSLKPSSAPELGVTLHVAGELDAHTAPGFREQVHAALSQVSGPIGVDCARLTFLDASGLGVLVYLANEARRQERAVYLRNLLPRATKLLSISGVDRLFDEETPELPSSA